MGSPKTATSSVQFVLKQNGRRLLKDGILVPRSGQTASGSHRYLALSLAGLPVPPEGEAAELKLAKEISESEADTVLISSEFLWAILMKDESSERLMARLRSLDVAVTVLLYVRNQPQYFNSMYQHDANFRRKREFSRYVSDAFRSMARHSYSRWLGFARTHGVPLLIRPFSQEVRNRGVVEDFLTTVGACASRYDTSVQLRRSVGPFTVAVAQSLMRRICDGRRLTEQQMSNCRRALRSELRQRRIVDHGYCGLTTGLAAEIEQVFSDDNSLFSQVAWGKPWGEVFASDVGRKFEPNDYSVTGVPADRRQLLGEVLASLEPAIEAIVSQSSPGSTKPKRWPLSALKSRFPV